MAKRAPADGRGVASRATLRLPPDALPDASRTGMLAGIVGHELNNISVPLKGFAELCLQYGAPNKTMREFLAEISIAVERARRLAADLDALGDPETRRARVTVESCLTAQGSGDAQEPAQWRIDWRCDAGSMVWVDRVHAQRAIDSLVTAAGRESSQPGFDLTVTSPIAAPAACIACDAELDSGAAYLGVQAFSSRAITRAALRDPFGPASAGRGTRRLTLAILVHCAHCAGGHVLLDQHLAALSIIFPLG